MTALTVVLLFGVIMLLTRFVETAIRDRTDADAEDLVGLSSQPTTEPTTQPNTEATAESSIEPTTEANPLLSDEHARTLEKIDLSSMQAQNSDVVGWILIPDTDISFPILHTDNNDYYLRRTWEKKYHEGGSIFLEYRCRPGFGDEEALLPYNTVIYGHHMSDGTMFSALKDYETQEFFNAHPYVYLADETGVYRYEVYSAYTADDSMAAYHLSFSSDEVKQNYIDRRLEYSVIDTGVTPTPDDRIITLSTCSVSGYYSYQTRWVVHCVLTDKLLK